MSREACGTSYDFHFKGTFWKKRGGDE